MSWLNILMDDNNLLARVEERLYSLHETVKQLEARILNGITDRLSALERQMVQLQSKQNGFDRYADLAFKVLATIVGAIILWKIGIPR